MACKNIFEFALPTNSNRLPVLATFIIDTDGKIVWKQFNPDYKIQASVMDVHKNIPATKSLK